MALILTDTQKVALSVSFTDKRGNPAKVDGAPVWASSDDSIVHVDAAADGFSATALASGALGNAQVSVTADADLGEGVQNVAGTLDIQVMGGPASVAAINAGTPEEQ